MVCKKKKWGSILLCLAIVLSVFSVPSEASASGFIQYDQVVSENGVLKAVNSFKASVTDYSINLDWGSPYSDYTVVIERSVGNDKNYTRYASFDVTDDTYSYSDSSVSKGIPYYYRIKVSSYTEEVEAANEEERYSDDFEYNYRTGKYVKRVKHEGSSAYEYSGKVMDSLDAPEIVNIESYDNRSVRIFWNDVYDADGYKIYRCIGKNGKYKLIKTMKATACLNKDYNYAGRHVYIDSNLAIGSIYYYKICAFKKDGNVKYNNAYSAEKQAIVTINNTKVSGGTSTSAGTNTIKWKKVSNCNGYIIYYKKKVKSKYVKLATIKNKNKTTYTHTGLVNGQRYYYKVVPYKTFKGQKITSSSNVYEKYCDYYAYENESYTQKCQRIFNTNERLEYATEAEALKHMKTINIKVWDKDSAGKWYTRTYDLTVHENIAPTVQQMFTELYNSKNPTPIHDIGCFSFRGGEHSIGLAIDINPEENCMMTNGVVESGSFWDPARSVYSIPMNCDLVRIFKKYGFSRGFWRNRKDYMHFSYFGT